MPRVESELAGKTLSGDVVSFSDEAYAEAMRLYRLKDIEAVATQVEDATRERRGISGLLSKFGIIKDKAPAVPEDVANFFRDFAIVQEVVHPDFDRAVAIGSLATRIELAMDQVPPEKLNAEFYDNLADARREYNLIFG